MQREEGSKKKKRRGRKSKWRTGVCLTFYAKDSLFGVREGENWWKGGVRRAKLGASWPDLERGKGVLKKEEADEKKTKNGVE